jgi:Rieske Fe-S protein
VSRTNRRKFISGITAAGTGTCLCSMSGCATFTKVGSTPAIPAGAYTIENNKMKVDLSKVPDLGKVGGSVKILDSQWPQPIIIGRSSDTDYVAASIQCPHRQVEVEYRHAEKQFRCASIGHSIFATDGTYRGGPAKKPLTRFEARRDPADKNFLMISWTGRDRGWR